MLSYTKKALFSLALIAVLAGGSSAMAGGDTDWGTAGQVGLGGDTDWGDLGQVGLAGDTDWGTDGQAGLDPSSNNTLGDGGTWGDPNNGWGWEGLGLDPMNELSTSSNVKDSLKSKAQSAPRFGKFNKKVSQDGHRAFRARF